MKRIIAFLTALLTILILCAGCTHNEPTVDNPTKESTVDSPTNNPAVRNPANVLSVVNPRDIYFATGNDYYD